MEWTKVKDSLPESNKTVNLARHDNTQNPIVGYYNKHDKKWHDAADHSVTYKNVTHWQFKEAE